MSVCHQDFHHPWLFQASRSCPYPSIHAAKFFEHKKHKILYYRRRINRNMPVTGSKDFPLHLASTSASAPFAALLLQFGMQYAIPLEIRSSPYEYLQTEPKNPLLPLPTCLDRFLPVYQMNLFDILHVNIKLHLHLQMGKT
jgi:hypothetical protein